MAGWDRSVIRAFAPAGVCWLLAAGGLLGLEWAQATDAQQDLQSALRWLARGGLLGCLVTGGTTAARLWAQRQATHEDDESQCVLRPVS